ncbi:hypothetical protein B566_EDAN016962 [Ephemera danica]|nr:hypothetical protein B566_EDAN016962 [Ephemera danica]
MGPHKYTYPYKYRQLGPDIYNFNLRPDDVWIVTFPRSGTTWTQEILYLLNTDLDFKTASNTHLSLRFPQLELSAFFSDPLIEKMRKQIKGQQQMEAHLDQILTNATHTLNETKNKRFIKTHIPFSLLPPALLDTCKVVYVCRHPKDVAVSYFHFCCTFVTFQYQGDFATFWNQFENNTCRFGPYWEHLREAWEQRNHPNMLFLFYEDTIKDTKSTIRKISAHFGKQMTDEQVQQIADHVHIDCFKMNTNVNYAEMPFAKVNKGDIIRKGKSEGWHDYFTPELNARADKWIAENIARLPGFAFPKHQ